VSGQRLDAFVAELGQHEFPYYDNKKRGQPSRNERMRKSDSKHGREPSIPHDDILQLKEASDRQRYREMLQSAVAQEQQGDTFSPVLSKAEVTTSTSFQPSAKDDEVEEGLVARMSNLLQFSVKGGDAVEDSSLVSMDNQDLLKGQYYYDKFGFTPFDAQKHIALQKAYIEALVWNLKYYYEGCVSWDWYYPYHYGALSCVLNRIGGLEGEWNHCSSHVHSLLFRSQVQCLATWLVSMKCWIRLALTS
jgi:5'-3' exonuclease